jgi:hypothetical protein
MKLLQDQSPSWLPRIAYGPHYWEVSLFFASPIIFACRAVGQNLRCLSFHSENGSNSTKAFEWCHKTYKPCINTLGARKHHKQRNMKTNFWLIRKVILLMIWWAHGHDLLVWCHCSKPQWSMLLDLISFLHNGLFANVLVSWTHTLVFLWGALPEVHLSS